MRDYFTNCTSTVSMVLLCPGYGHFSVLGLKRVLLEGESSDMIPMTSGVPQRSVLEPILFLVYINDLPESISSQVRLFAVYLTINDKDSDGSTLQADLDKLQE